MLELADATPEDDTAEILEETTIALWKGGPRFNLKTATNKAIREATAKVRAHNATVAPEKKGRGKRVASEEHVLAGQLAKTLGVHGIKVVVAARAGAPGKASRYEIGQLSADDVSRLIERLGAKRAPSRG